MIELAAFFYVGGVVVSTLVVAAAAALAGFGFFIWGLVSAAERVRMPRIRVGTWRGMGGFTLRLLALFGVACSIAVLCA